MQPQMNDDGARSLAASILQLACKDFITGRKDSAKESAEKFLPSEWCCFLCEELELNHKFLVQATREKRLKYLRGKGN